MGLLPYSIRVYKNNRLSWQNNNATMIT
jgi:hypothetical protein